ncbi:hypothetical protein [Thermodesulforhabdus norvegica]|uniref:DUF106 domain-containing protein n=1 Tax=Thermodesulforhabdus norvegica TaxID=39841 RepID=A0A1I4QKY9_9BACT|nr:hypothetical protein [Thermodesulforhabdus norvegica]SFM40293.1 hypothetical protein SAMN05660836_00074 [Thermodesulforhabdus norvegica]
MHALYMWLDSYLIELYRIIDDPIYAFFLGTFLLAALAVFIGQFSISLAFLANRRYMERLGEELTRWNNLSLEALAMGDRKAYEGANNQANEAFGKLFFLSVAHSAASLWPAPFFLGWMQIRFSGIEFPLPFSLPFVGSTVGFAFFFIAFFAICHITFGKLQPHLPYFGRIYALLKVYDREKKRRKDISRKASEEAGGERIPHPLSQ